MADRLIVVTYDDSDRSLKIVPDRLDIGDGNWVVWQFVGVPVACLPYIRFASGFGPFLSLRSYDAMHIVSKGHRESTGNPATDTYVYTAMILQPAMAEPVARQAGTIVNQATSEDPLPEVRVIFHRDRAAGSNLEVFPKRIRINQGDLVNWTVTGLPEGAFVTFQFLDDQDASAHLFKSFSLRPEGPDVVASGMGFLTQATEPGSFKYLIRVRDADGILLGGHDPAIDNIGPPIGSGDPGDGGH